MATKKQQPEVAFTEVTAKRNLSDWFNSNTKVIYSVVGGILAVAVIWWAYKNFYATPRQQEASAKIRFAEALFERDSFQQALDLPINGFRAIANDYSGTPSGNAAKGYAGICLMNVGKFDEAIAMLESFKPEGNISPAVKFGLLGDAYSEKKDFGKAADYYKKASRAGDVEDLKAYNLKKCGLLYEMQKNYAEALACYQTIKKEFPTTSEGRDIEKYITRAEALKK